MTNVRPPERRQLTVMMCDLVGSTELSLRLDPEELTEVVQAYRRRCTNVINSNGGIVAQFVGDGALAYFGYPRAHEDDAERAIRAALAIAAAGQSASEIADLNVHIGIATGRVVVGYLSGDQPAMGGADPQGREEVSAVGSALNLAARLQGLAEPGMVVVSEQTRRLSRGIFEYSDLGRHDLKGFDQPVQAWQVLGERGVRSRFHALRASALTPLVGRQSELRELRQLWDSVQAGKGRALLLSAEPGVGKSRLAEVVARQIVGRRCLRLWCYCSPHSQSSPLAPLIRLLTHAAGFRHEDDDDSKLHKLISLSSNAVKDASEMAPLLANLLSIPYESKYPPLNMSPQRQKHRLFQALIQLFEALACHGPVLLVVEDLHWIDPSSEELIGLLIDRLKELPILAILTARPEFQSHWDDRPHLLHMPLSPLERHDTLAMIELLCGNRNIPESTVGQIADKTDGLPLFIEDLTREVLEFTDRQETGSAPLTQPERSPFAIPATLTDSLMSRLDRLGSAKAVAQLGATLGREFSYELLARVVELREEDLKEELYRLVNSGLLIRRPSTTALRYAFRHALVRDAAYSSLLKKARVALHSRIARILVEDFPETEESQPELLAYHFEAARDIGNAVHYMVKAAELSAKRSGFVEAISQLNRALSLLETQPGSRSRLRQELEVYLALGGINAEYRGFSAAECGDAYTAALALCRELGDAPEIFSALSGIGSFAITRARFQECRALAEECLSRAAQQQSSPPFIMGHRLLGGTLFLTGEFADARKHLEEALRIYERGETPHRGAQVFSVQDHRSTALCYLALTLTILGYPDSGLRAAENSLSHSQSLGNVHSINFSLCYLSVLHHIRRDSREALRRATESLELAREQGFATFIGASQMIRGESLVGNGEYEEGFKEIASGMKAHSGMEATAYQPLGISVFVRGLIAGSRVDEALAALGQALAISERTGERFYLAELWRLKGEVLARKSSLPEAEHWFREAIELSRQQEAKLFELRSAASLCRLLDNPRKEAALRDMLEPVYDWFKEGADAPDVREARALLTGKTDSGINH